MKELNPSERRALRARAHGLHPIVMIGSAGLTPGVLHEIDLALKSHELMKIRMLGDDREARERAIERICDTLDASPVQVIGKILVVYRPAPEPVEEPPVPRPAGKKKHAKRSRQGSRSPR
jgi:putative YhbY family RNA-binding protein